MKRTPLTPPPLPDIEGIKQRRFKLDVLLKQQPELWPSIYDRCKRDPLFWAEQFCFIYDEHTTVDRRIRPLAMYDFQKALFLEIVENIIRAAQEPNYFWDSATDKPRYMAITFTHLLAGQYVAQFHGLSGVITYKDEQSVDIPEDMDTPMRKLKWQIERQPRELLPAGFDMKNKKLYKTGLVNFTNGAQITGVAPTGEAVRGSRALWWYGDEFAFPKTDYQCWDGASGTVKCRMVSSTPNGENCKFHFLIYQDELEPEDRENIRVFAYDWWDHPEHAQGLYRKADGSISSPWWDAQVEKNTKQVLAREYLRDHANSLGGKVYFMFRRTSIFDELEPDRDTKTIYRCWDPGGLWFAVTFGQKDSDGAFRHLHELALCRERISNAKSLTRTIAEQAIQIAEERFGGYEIYDIGDPYGAKITVGNQEESEFGTLKKYYEINPQSAFLKNMPTHTRIVKRVELMSNLLMQDVERADGSVRPLIQVCRRYCPLTIQAYQVKYRYVVEKDGTVTSEIRDGRPFNDLMDDWGYTALRLYDKPANNEPLKVRKAQPTEWRQTTSRIKTNSTMGWRRSGRNY